MKVVLVDGEVTYDGRQLATAFVDAHARSDGDAVVLFEGPADVPIEHLVDLEDAEANRPIASALMAHAIVEHRGLDLTTGVLAQRLLGRLAADFIARRSGISVTVSGDDLFVGDGKLSVSIATTSPRGVLIHFAVNVLGEGAPVKIACLRDLRLPGREFLRALGKSYAAEISSVDHAVRKVRPVP